METGLYYAQKEWNIMSDRDKVKRDILLAMYRSVERQNEHLLKGNDLSAEAERWLQVNLRHSFNEVSG